MSLYPVTLNIEGTRCICIGGGVVMARKVFSLLDCGGLVRVVSPRLVPSLQERVDDGRIEYYARCYRYGDLDGAVLAFAATNDEETQKAVVAEAEEKHLWINVANDPVSSSFHVPAKVCRGDLLLTVSTGGASPALSAQIRSRLEEEFGPAYTPLLQLMRRIRQKVVTDGRYDAEHRQMFYTLLQTNMLELVEQKNIAELRVCLERTLPAEMVSDDLFAGLFS